MRILIGAVAVVFLSAAGQTADPKPQAPPPAGAEMTKWQGLAKQAPAKAEEAKQAAPPAVQATQAKVAAELDVKAPFKPLPKSFESAKNPISDAKVTLGRMLYFDKRLSKNHDLSCNTCHDLNKYGVDGLRFSKGHKGQLGGRNSPTVYNAAGLLVQFWDGRSPDVEDQAKGPVLNPVEMAMPDDGRVVATLKSIPEYAALFQQAFPGEAEPITFDNAARAIGAFERGLVTPSRFDRFLAGSKNALNPVELAGLKAFVNTGCSSCHSGALVGGTMFQKLGVAVPYTETTDQGRYEVTKAEYDKMIFRVPSLRNVARTGPYFHHGKYTDLGEAVKVMAKHQLGKDLSQREVLSIVAFLRSLTGELPRTYIAAPKLPKSTADTPKPDPA